MSKISDYLWYLAHTIFKSNKLKTESDVYKTLNLMAVPLDDVKQEMFLLREMACVASAYGKSLDRHGRDRKMLRFVGESDARYRDRLLAAFDFYQLGGTAAGMILGLALIGFPGAEVYPLYKEKDYWVFLNGIRRLDGSWRLDHAGTYVLLNGKKSLDGSWHLAPIDADGRGKKENLDRWNEFIVDLKTPDKISENEMKLVLMMIKKMKPSYTKLAAVYTHPPKRLDGTWYLDGKADLDNNRITGV